MQCVGVGSDTWVTPEYVMKHHRLEVDMLFVHFVSWAVSPEDRRTDGAEALTFPQKVPKQLKPPRRRLPMQA